MGMYTELHLNVELIEAIPAEVLGVLRFMTGESEERPESLPDHPLFSTARWGYMLRSDSFYFDMLPDSRIGKKSEAVGEFYLSVRCNLKNYDGEIRKFIDWLTPYVQTTGLWGYWRYEECDEPTLIYSPGFCPAQCREQEKP